MAHQLFDDDPVTIAKQINMVAVAASGGGDSEKYRGSNPCRSDEKNQKTKKP
jgi:hypothetical protein